MRPFAIFAFSSILCITLIALPINAELVCPIDIPLSTCAACQAAIDSIFSPNYFNGNGPPPDKFHPCDFYSRTEWEVIRRWRPGTSPFDATVPQLLKDAFDAACSNSSTCTEQEAIDGSKIIETGCGELVEASNDAGIVNATMAYIILRNFFPEKNVYCNKDANGDNYGWQILRDVINYAATIVPRGIAGLIVPPNPALVFVTFDNTTGSPSVHGIPDSVICSNAYKYMVSTFSSFVDTYPLDPRFSYLTENLKLAKLLIQNNCNVLPQNVKEFYYESLSRQYSQLPLVRPPAFRSHRSN